MCLTHPTSCPEVADQFTAHLIWMSAGVYAARPLVSDEDRHRTVPAQVTELKHRIDVNNYG